MNGKRVLTYWLVGCAVVSLTVALAKSCSLPIGYLHSWNQITTLTTIRSVGMSDTKLLHPKEVTARVTWPGDLDLSLSWANDPRFNAFEEFPLYHGLAALLVQSGYSPEFSGHILSISLWILSAVGLFMMTSSFFGSTVAHLTAILFLTSFPALYYGQAIMSDIGMLAFLIAFLWSLQSKAKAFSKNKIIVSAIFLALAALFKSYAIFFAPVLIFGLNTEPKDTTKTIYWFSVCMAAASSIPVMSWHLYTALQSGHNEALSHSWLAKQNMLLSSELYHSVIKTWFRYLGSIPGTLVLLIIGALLWNRKSIFKECPAWFAPYTFCLLLYLAFSVDKLPYHDYYFLPVIPVLYPFAAAIITKGVTHLNLKDPPARTTFLIIAALFTAHFYIGIRSFLKATKMNPDVLKCAEAIRDEVPDDRLIVTLTDVSRYNSLQYYSGRMGISVEGNNFPLNRYTLSGASFLVINLSPQEKQNLEPWLVQELQSATHRKTVRNLFDAKNRPRSCEIYQLDSEI